MGLAYFEIFEIPVQLNVKKSDITSTFFALSRKYHPDYYINKTAAEQAEALERAALINKAYKTFQSTDATIKYVLQEKGLLADDEKFELPSAFLMNVMDINEALMDATDDIGKEKLLHQIIEIEKDSFAPVASIINNYQEGSTTVTQLLEVKEYYYKKKYIERIKKEMGF
ncbi:MAG: hypothetical protein RL115_2446 [Bacteroidota bacterium]|jgi:molecular chaperone HscB